MLRAVVSWADTARARETRGQSAETTQQSKQILGGSTTRIRAGQAGGDGGEIKVSTKIRGMHFGEGVSIVSSLILQ